MPLPVATPKVIPIMKPGSPMAKGTAPLPGTPAAAAAAAANPYGYGAQAPVPWYNPQGWGAVQAAEKTGGAALAIVKEHPIAAAGAAIGIIVLAVKAFGKR